MLTFCYFWTDLVIRAVVTISAILLKYPTSESGFHALKYKYIIRVYLHYREKTVKFCLIKYVPYWAKINLITWTSNLKSKRLLTFIFSVRISFWLSLPPWPQAWGHIFLVSCLRFRIYWIEKKIWKWSCHFEFWSWFDYSLMRFHHLFDLMMKYQLFHHLFLRNPQCFLT